MIKNIVFDLGGVVLPLTPDEAWNRFEALGIKNARQQMGLYGQTGIFLQVENGEIDEEQFLNELTKQARQQSQTPDNPVHPITYQQAQWAWKGYLDNVELFRLNNLLKLKESYSLFLLSNINPFVVKWASQDDFSGDGHSLPYYFDKTFYSYEMKDYKPAESIFRKMVHETGINPDETIFLDDGKRNVEAAQRVGFHGLLVEENRDWMPALLKRLQDETN